jgi:hypothetical protein
MGDAKLDGSHLKRLEIKTDTALTAEAIPNSFATAGRVLPLAALEQAVDRLSEVGPVLLATLEAASDKIDQSDRTNAILFFGIYLMAQVRDTRAFRPRCIAAADGDRIFRLIGELSPREFHDTPRGAAGNETNGEFRRTRLESRRLDNAARRLLGWAAFLPREVRLPPPARAA